MALIKLGGSCLLIVNYADIALLSCLVLVANVFSLQLIIVKPVLSLRILLFPFPPDTFHSRISSHAPIAPRQY